MCWRVVSTALLFLLKEGKILMINFENVEALVSHMFDCVNAEDPVTVVANKDLAIGVMNELLNYNNVALEIVDIDSFEYDKEYFVTLLYDEDEEDYWRVSVEKAYNDFHDQYFGTDGYVLFHEDINCKVFVDMQNNENVTMSRHDWFVIGEDDSFETDDDEENNQEYLEDEEHSQDSCKDSNAEYTVTVKCNVDPGDVVGMVRDVERSVLYMYEMFYEMNRFRRLFGW